MKTLAYPDWMYSQIDYDAPQKVDDLAYAVIPDADDEAMPLLLHRRMGAKQDNVGVEVVFQDLEDRIINWIDGFDVIVGCVAWLTNRPILEALARRQWVAIIVQKEDWLRPDSGGWTEDLLRHSYGALKGGYRNALKIGHYNYCGDPTLPPVMCAGLAPERKQSALPRMHHKFLVGCNLRHEHVKISSVQWRDGQRIGVEDEVEVGETYAHGMEVWTGSFNLTHNGTKSLENAVILRSEKIANAYLKEARKLYGIAETLQWNSRWVQPEFRIGS